MNEMTEEEFRAEMKKLGWNDEAIEEMIKEHNDCLREYSVAIPFEALLEEKPLIEVQTCSR